MVLPASTRALSEWREARVHLFFTPNPLAMPPPVGEFRLVHFGTDRVAEHKFCNNKIRTALYAKPLIHHLLHVAHPFPPGALWHPTSAPGVTLPAKPIAGASGAR